MSRCKIFFNSSPKPTIGVEVELQILDNETFELASGAGDILSEFQDNLHVKEELLDSIIEINTGVCKNVSEVISDLTEYIQKASIVAEKKGYSLASIATHPFSKWKDQSVTKSERYLHFLDRMQWPLRRLLITGVHVHVGVESGEKAIAISNGLTRYIPMMIGLSANSPFFGGEQTGLASTRTKIFEGLPTAGLPPLLKNYSEFQKFMRTLQKAKSIDSIREVWWDVRPHPGFGTVEIRVFDSVPSIPEMANLAALTQCLVVAISEHYDEGSQPPLLDSWVLRENKWRSTRYGLDADLIIDEMGHQQSLKSFIFETLDKLMPIAKTLECESQLNALAEIAENNTAPYQRQIRAYEQNKDFTDIMKNAIVELKSGFEVYA
ncbi:MAG: glutamate--cysteine ligase [Candidatus Marinimicrobia bacterium]|nr:glutamate--cysteine ligase [Candidatus Neomarinimicrobiota bacterium]